MSEIFKISQQATFDLTELLIEYLDESNGICFVKSKQVFKFDQVFGNIINRSRVLRQEKIESQMVEQVIAAVVDAGFCGYLAWKIKLTKQGLTKILSLNSIPEFASILQGCQQLQLFPSPAGNYYSGTNQTELESEIIFTL